MKKTATERLDSTQPVEDTESFDPELKRAFDYAHNSVDPDIIGDRSQVKIKKDSILLSGDRAFYTLQGEGPTLGMPCVFVRLHVCNLRCSWCDAFYTWNPNSEEFWQEATRMSFEECAELIEQTWGGGTGIKRVVWTGGEPLIQKAQISKVIQKLYRGGMWYHEIETNGTLMPTEWQLKYAQFNCSPKLKNSENKDYTMVKPKVLTALNYANTTFKFVCRDELDLYEIEERYLPHISRYKIIIMPEGVWEEEITKHARQLIEPVKERGWRMTPRFQATFADGAKRGV